MFWTLIGVRKVSINELHLIYSGPPLILSYPLVGIVNENSKCLY
jgi:hypothetical protein